MIIIDKPHLTQVMEVWSPKYNNTSLTQDYGEQVALLHKGKVHDHTSGYIIVKFPKAKHLTGRYAIRRDFAKQHAIGTNGKAPMYEIPMSHFEPWISREEEKEQVTETLVGIGWWV